MRLIEGKIDPAQANAALAAYREPARPLRRNRSEEKPAAASDEGARERLTLPASGDLPMLLLKTRIKSEVERARLLELKAKVETGRFVDADEELPRSQKSTP